MEELNPNFKKDNNPRRLHEGHFRAFVSHCPKFSTFVAFYQDAVESLFKRVSEGNETPDMVAFPLLFLMRHTLELGYKYSLFHLCALNSTQFDPQNVERHSLVKLHKRLGNEYYAALGNGSFPESDKESFEKYYALTEYSMKRFEVLDASSTRTRFPNPDESPAFSQETTVNLLELKNEFDDAMTLLTTMADVIGEYDWANYPEFNP
jgi:hypothetical protein